jgi:hypothetical protein
LLGDGVIAFQPENRAAYTQEPGLVKRSTPHLGTACIVAVRPVKKFDVGFVEFAARCNRLMTIARDLSRPQASQANVCGNEEEDD